MRSAGRLAKLGLESSQPLATLAHDDSVSSQIVVDSMHERKVVMAKRVGGFIGLPGGFGTFEEVRVSPRPRFHRTTPRLRSDRSRPLPVLNGSLNSISLFFIR